MNYHILRWAVIAGFPKRARILGTSLAATSRPDQPKQLNQPVTVAGFIVSNNGYYPTSLAGDCQWQNQPMLLLGCNHYIYSFALLLIRKKNENIEVKKTKHGFLVAYTPRRAWIAVAAAVVAAVAAVAAAAPVAAAAAGGRSCRASVEDQWGYQWWLTVWLIMIDNG